MAERFDRIWYNARLASLREDLPDLYREAACFVLPSKLEGFGLPLLEAMASGVPVIGSDAGAVPEVAGGAAVLFPAGDSSVLASALVRVLDRPDERARLKAAGLARAGQPHQGGAGAAEHGGQIVVGRGGGFGLDVQVGGGLLDPGAEHRGVDERGVIGARRHDGAGA